MSPSRSTRTFTTYGEHRAHRQTFVNLDNKSIWGSGYSTIVAPMPEMPRHRDPVSTSRSSWAGGGAGEGGTIKMEELSPEEERVRVRRERNKLAAVRCRKRRVDQTDTLQGGRGGRGGGEEAWVLQEEIHSLQARRRSYSSSFRPTRRSATGPALQPPPPSPYTPPSPCQARPPGIQSQPSTPSQIRCSTSQGDCEGREPRGRPLPGPPSPMRRPLASPQPNQSPA